jgi:hypothetical protein
MTSLSAYRAQWFGNVRGDLLAGLVVALALIPEAIAFSIIAGVDPQIGLYASFSIAVLIAFVGGRPGMISAAWHRSAAGPFSKTRKPSSARPGLKTSLQAAVRRSYGNGGRSRARLARHRDRPPDPSSWQRVPSARSKKC